MKNANIFRDFRLINPNTKKGREAIVGAVQAHWNRCSSVVQKLQNVGISEFTTTENFPDAVLKMIEKFHVDVTELDLAYEPAFDILDLTSTPTSSFTIRDAKSGLTFNRVREGMKAKTYSVEGAETTVTLDLYGGALDWMKTWFDDNEWWTIEDNAVEFRRKWFEAKATIFYNMIQTLTNSAVYNEIWYITGVTTQIEKDIMTINNAVVTLIERTLNDGLGVTAGTPLVMLVPLSMKSRVVRALEGRPSSDNTGGLVVNYNITPYFTSGITWAAVGAVTGGAKWIDDDGATAAEGVPLGYLSIPGRKNKIGNRMNLTMLADTDILAFATTVAGWGRYGAYMNMEQWIRVLSIT